MTCFSTRSTLLSGLDAASILSIYFLTELREQNSFERSAPSLHLGPYRSKWVPDKADGWTPSSSQHGDPPASAPLHQFAPSLMFLPTQQQTSFITHDFGAFRQLYAPFSGGFSLTDLEVEYVLHLA